MKQKRQANKNSAQLITRTDSNPKELRYPNQINKKNLIIESPNLAIHGKKRKFPYHKGFSNWRGMSSYKNVVVVGGGRGSTPSPKITKI